MFRVGPVASSSLVNPAKHSATPHSTIQQSSEPHIAKTLPLLKCLNKSQNPALDPTVHSRILGAVSSGRVRMVQAKMYVMCTGQASTLKAWCLLS